MKTLFVLALVVAAAAARDLNGAKVLRVVPQTETQLRFLVQLLQGGDYDFWSEPRGVGAPVDVMVTAQQLPKLAAHFNRSGLKAELRLGDVGRLVEEQKKERSNGRAMDWTSYHTYDEINDWLASLVSTYPTLCSIEAVGTSYEGRTMNLLTIGKGGADKPGIFIDGGIHAREWISPATVTFMVNELVTNSATYDDILSNVNFYVMPAINPDGYAYTFSDDRLWRKTRSPTDSALGCVGADPNRNWDHHWMEVGASSSPCAETYAGPTPFSEVEMQVVRDQINRYASTVKAYLTFHSYSQLWMYPWGYTSALPDDWQDLDNLAQDAVSALTAVYGTTYEIGSSTNTIYAAAGGSDDWAKGVAGVKYAYTIELRDTGNFGFLLPASQIIPSGEETFQGLLVVANFIKDTYSK
ncbi:carboxypeptidase B-like [Eriocheir sinensis]|uniref:carboxypeptidase B-like n=1 Tax=Eriocheir sinensis TaxID=95602 RepID=UPI0021C74B32|nr:carboxypeptidase B-like [Eriocheir sinensis]XP_050697048.1 carboxypeptidase B-like [Eriocheir sinensis]XP_050697049.1 carboxypeptidase B-like [Eriocheir sinensis]